MEINQIIIILALLVTLYSWIIGKPRKLISSSFLLLVFLVFGNTPFKKVLSFPFSPSFFVIVLSFVFSQGIINSGLTEKFIEPSLARFSKSRFKFLAFTCLVIFIASWLIPQPFSRAVLLALVYRKFFKEAGLEETSGQALLFIVFALSIVFNSLFKDVDIILNQAMLTISGMNFTSLEWSKIFLPPGLLVLATSLLGMSFIFKKELKDLEELPVRRIDTQVEKDDWINLGLIFLTVILWLTEGLHGIDGAIFVALGIGAMYLRGLLELEDFKSINIELLVFLTAAFSIGNVMMGSGIAGSLFGRFTELVPQDFSYKFVLLAALVTFFFHTILGSAVTTMSVVIPSLFSLVAGVDPLVISIVVFASIYMQYILPVHNALLTVGVGNGFYGNGPVVRYGIYSTLLTLAALFLFYLPWWKFIGLI